MFLLCRCKGNDANVGTGVCQELYPKCYIEDDEIVANKSVARKRRRLYSLAWAFFRNVQDLVHVYDLKPKRWLK